MFEVVRIRHHYSAVCIDRTALAWRGQKIDWSETNSIGRHYTFLMHNISTGISNDSPAHNESDSSRRGLEAPAALDTTEPSDCKLRPPVYRHMTGQDMSVTGK